MKSYLYPPEAWHDYEMNQYCDLCWQEIHSPLQHPPTAQSCSDDEVGLQLPLELDHVLRVLRSNSNFLQITYYIMPYFGTSHQFVVMWAVFFVFQSMLYSMSNSVFFACYSDSNHITSTLPADPRVIFHFSFLNIQFEPIAAKLHTDHVLTHMLQDTIDCMKWTLYMRLPKTTIHIA